MFLISGYITHSDRVVKLLPARSLNLKLTFNVSHQLSTRAEKWNVDHVDVDGGCGSAAKRRLSLSDFFFLLINPVDEHL